MSPRCPPIATVALVALALGCTHPQPRSARRGHRPTAPTPPAVRAPFAPRGGDAIFANAVHLLSGDGYALKTCDPDLGALATERVELDVQCGTGSCLARQRVVVKLGYRMARVVVAREVWDFSLKEWVPVSDPALREALAVEGTELIGRILAVPPQRAGDPEGAADPCAAGPCGRGGCIGLAPVPAP
jgi:hypothetical protein